MASSKHQVFIFCNLLLLAVLSNGSSETETRVPYIVYMGHVAQTDAAEDHHNLLLNAIGDEKVARQSKIHSYRKSFNAFAANLLPHEADLLKDMEGVISVFLSTTRKLHTTRSWDFVGLPQVRKGTHDTVQSNIIIGLLDTGIYTASPSFNDEGYGPPPAKWKGTCDHGANFMGCNNKVIGSRWYRIHAPKVDDVITNADYIGHGTHTSSTAVGSPVENANFYDLAKGTARGGAPSARIAMYKVCWSDNCYDIDILAAFDDAIHDGVDIISLSLGGSPQLYFQDAIAIGSFHADRKGIVMTCSAGNEGPAAMSVSNLAPWILTVAANGMDRSFQTDFLLGNGTRIHGVSVNSFMPKKHIYPLITGPQAASNDSDTIIFACDVGTLDKNKVKGKVVYCRPGLNGISDGNIKDLGGAGMIIPTENSISDAFSFSVPAAVIKQTTGDMIEKYINTTDNPEAVIYKSVVIKTTGPFVASFSSRGPNGISRYLLKPDISAPGVDILAAWTPLASPTDELQDKRRVKYNIISGTSMACPHVAAAAAYVKTVHPDWPPSRIKSALMTTATDAMVTKDDEKPSPFGYGSGQIDPRKAIHPGLVYDISSSAYVRYLCKEGYNSTTLRLLIGGGAGGKRHWSCSDFPATRGSDGLNYPTIQLTIPSPKTRISSTFVRTVTNVGHGNSTYKATVKSPGGLKVTVTPNTLTFNKRHEKKTFKVKITGKLPRNIVYSTTVLQWSDSIHTVRSPIVVVCPTMMMI